MKNLKEALELRKGMAGTRGIPDGSGPNGNGPTGRRKGMCPLRKDYESDEEYGKAMSKWKASNKKSLKKSIDLMKSKYSKRVGTPGHYKYFYGDEGKSTVDNTKEGSVKGVRQKLSSTEKAKNLRDKLKLNNRPSIFSSEDRARNYAENAKKPMRVVLGDNSGKGKQDYFVASPGDAEKLVRAGYEYAPDKVGNNPPPDKKKKINNERA